MALREPEPAVPIIALRDVRLSFGGHEVLAGVNLEVERGEKVVLIGKSGSGKSSILRVLMGLDRPTTGRVELSGRALWSLPSGEPASETHLRELRSRLGIVFQHFNLFPHMTAEDNVALALKLVKKLAPADARRVARDHLAQVGLADRARAFPVQLSGGQRQRVAIARALAMQPDILLLDEVTSGLDPELIEEVVVTIEALSTAQRTLLIVTHQRDFARRVATRVVRIEAGRIAGSGAADELLVDGSLHVARPR